VLLSDDEWLLLESLYQVQSVSINKHCPSYQHISKQWSTFYNAHIQPNLLSSQEEMQELLHKMYHD